ncbi:MAG: CDP-alcohol phosphatidyltransferase family protein [Pseudomonadales bacterium]|nr:CDP-alcohol phosphatidyltransferase family protein [Pseudomonadales bacterium]MDP6472030.1 CDP-alcohol phosphatidyltransferase family protein [Pseudomonadales bacterium]MDP6826697.1 CDP-alcohol phosphatidyltransferase family protein [Pseudomonadales bacterium]MDP6969942.1 CDP-alcohol phosphatidyltransferase family protein [Pseudomonadales bacterium]
MLAQIPNIITIARILLVGPIAWLLWETRYVDVFILVFIAGLSDALDGVLARHFGWMSRFGAVMDPVADKLLVLVAFVIFFLQGHIPTWLVLIVVLRDVVIMGGAGVYWLWFHELELSPTFISKINTALQIVLLLLLLVELCAFTTISAWAGLVVDPWGFYLLAVLALMSGGDYVITWSGKAWRNKHPLG